MVFLQNLIYTTFHPQGLLAHLVQLDIFDLKLLSNFAAYRYKCLLINFTDFDFDFTGNVNVCISYSHKSAKQFPKNHNGENHNVINLPLLEPSWNLLKETEINKY